jgi:hypothetical protein
LTFSGLHGVVSQKTALFISTAVRTSGPTHNIEKSPFRRPGCGWEDYIKIDFKEHG